MHVPFSRSIIQFCREKQELKQQRQSNWTFSQERWAMIKNEWQDWQKHYLPIDLHNKVVLDVGAGEGETAKLFLEAGAKYVLAIEPNNQRFKILKSNAAKHPKIIPINGIFKLNMLNSNFFYPYDFLKMDIEGYEEILLDYKLNKPAVLELHGLQMRDYFEAQGWRIEKHKNTDYWTCYAYWRC